MNTEKFEALVKLLETNPEAREAVTGITVVAEVLPVLAQYGLEITEEEFVEYVQAMHADELPEELLQYVVGGGKFWNFVQGFLDGFYDATIGLFNKR